PSGDQCQMQGGCSRIDPDCVRNSKVLGHRALELFDEWPQAKGALLEQAAYVGQCLRFDLPPLKRQIGEGNVDIDCAAAARKRRGVYYSHPQLFSRWRASPIMR